MTSGNRFGDGSDSRQKQAGAALRQGTRDRLLEAAATEFAAHGYAATTVAQLAAAAGVSVQSVYSAGGGKRELLRGYLEGVLAGGADAPADAITRFSGRSARERLIELADLVTEVARRAAAGWYVYREGAAVDPGIAADWNELQLLRYRLVTQLVIKIPGAILAEGLSHRGAGAAAWVIASPDSYDLLVRRLGYTVEQFRGWVQRTLITVILEP